MTTTLGLMSDLHATPLPVEQALSVFQDKNVDRIFCLGDIAGYGENVEDTVSLLAASECQSILGNHEQWYLEQGKDRNDPVLQYFSSLPRFIRLTVEGIRIYLVHASPPDLLTDGIRLLDEHGDLVRDEQVKWSHSLESLDCDVLVVGHTHQVFAEKIGGKLVINPGSTAYNHCCAILEIPAMKVSWIPLSGRKIMKSWNWGMNVNRIKG